MTRLTPALRDSARFPPIMDPRIPACTVCRYAGGCANVDAWHGGE